MGYFPRNKLNELAQIIRRLEAEKSQDGTNALNDFMASLDRCLQKVDDDEPIFVLRAQDDTAPVGVHDWLNRNLQLSPERVNEARQLILDMFGWQKTHPDRVKRPD